jgi:hypothetical protein
MPLVLNLIALLKPLDTSGSIHDAPLAGKERVTVAAHLDFELLFRRAGGEPVPAGTDYLGIGIILGMNLLFHIIQLPGR